MLDTVQMQLGFQNHLTVPLNELHMTEPLVKRRLSAYVHRYSDDSGKLISCKDKGNY